MAVKLICGFLILSLTACGVQRPLVRPADIPEKTEEQTSRK
jgi:predicted small lipoprotein YifL